MQLFAKTEPDYLLKELGKKLVDTDPHPREILEDKKEQEFYLDSKYYRISIPILEGYWEKAEERAFDKDTSSNSDYRKSKLAKEAVRALTLIRKIALLREIKEKDDLVSKVNEEIISIGDKANIFRPEFALKGITYGMVFSAVPFAYNLAEGTIERRLETAEKIIEKGCNIYDFIENMLALYSKLGTKYAQRIAEKLSEQYSKSVEDFEGKYGYRESVGNILKMTKELCGKRKDLFKEMEKFLDRELFARVKYPNSRIAKLRGKVIVIPEDKEKIIVINGKEKELTTKQA